MANLVRFNRREIVLLRRRPRANELRRGQDAGNQEEKMYFVFHGCFSAGGAAACWSPGRRGKSILSISSSIPTRSWRTSYRVRSLTSGDTHNTSLTHSHLILNSRIYILQPAAHTPST